jgi:hypothetical protein
MPALRIDSVASAFDLKGVYLLLAGKRECCTGRKLLTLGAFV